MPTSHEKGAYRDSEGATEPTIGEVAAEDGSEVSETGVETKDLGGERRFSERPDKALDGGAEGGEGEDVLDVSGLEQLVGHIEDEECLHAEVAEALPAFGEAEVHEAAGVTEDVGGGAVRSLGRGGLAHWRLEGPLGFPILVARRPLCEGYCALRNEEPS